MEAVGSSRSQVLAGTSPSPPTRPSPPARQVSGRAAALLFSFTSWRKMLCRTHITRPVHTRAPLRAEQGAGPGRPRSTRVSARPAGTSRDSGNETSRPAELSPNFAERRAEVAAAPLSSRRLRCRLKFGCLAVAAEFGRRRRKGRHCETPRERSGAALRGGERAGPGAALEAAGAEGGGSLPVLRESSGKKMLFVLKVSYGGILRLSNRVRVSGTGAPTCPQLSC